MKKGTRQMKENINVQLSELNDGGLQERFNHELKKVVENVMDPNTSQKKKRKIAININVIPTDDYRDEIIFDVEVKSTLAPRENVGGRILIGQDQYGEAVANELRSGQRGQMFFDEQDNKLKTDTGRPIEEIEQEQAEAEIATITTTDGKEVNADGEVINFRRKQSN